MQDEADMRAVVRRRPPDSSGLAEDGTVGGRTIAVRGWLLAV